MKEKTGGFHKHRPNRLKRRFFLKKKKEPDFPEKTAVSHAVRGIPGRMISLVEEHAQGNLEWFANECGFSTERLCRITEGKEELDAVTVLRIFNKFGIRPELILTGRRTTTIEEAGPAFGLLPNLPGNNPDTRADTRKAGVTQDTNKGKKCGFYRFFPWAAYEESAKLYLNVDDTVGFIWECNPDSFRAGGETDLMEKILRPDLPSNTQVQFILQVEFDRAIEGPISRVRRFVSLKTDRQKNDPADLGRIYGDMREVLQGLNLCPRDLSPEALIQWMRNIFNNSCPKRSLWNPLREINRQVMLPGTRVETEDGNLAARYESGGQRTFRGLTLNSLNENVRDMNLHEMLKTLFVMENGGEATPPCGLLYTLNAVKTESSATRAFTSQIAAGQNLKPNSGKIGGIPANQGITNP